MKFAPGTRFTIHFFVHSVPFTRAVLNHETSLGGSESACRVLAEALAVRGHDVHIFATQLEAPGEYRGVQWHDARTMPDVHRFAPPDVFVSLRMPLVFQSYIPAKLRLLWTQDLLVDDSFIGSLYNVDRMVYVSQYHREQWQGRQPMLKALAPFVTKNPIDPADLETALAGPVAKLHRRLIFVSRPERGYEGLLALWPQVRERWPDATLALCRYSSMYDKDGWGKVCAAYDRQMIELDAQVGGIVWLGELDKVALYREIAQSVAMVYPASQPHFAETNCIAATEAQACGTPFIGSRLGGLPETLHPEAGLLVPGADVQHNPEAQAGFLDAIAQIFDEHEHPEETFDRYARKQQAGRLHAYEAEGNRVAAAWEQMLIDTFQERYRGNRLGVLRQLLHWDNHAAAQIVAREIADMFEDAAGDEAIPEGRIPAYDEALAALERCANVIAQYVGPAEYAAHAMDPHAEAEVAIRLHRVTARVQEHVASLQLDRPVRILDVSCGNGSMAICLAQTLPDAIIHGVDYSPELVEIARKATSQFGRRVRFWQGESTADGLAEFRRDRVMAGDLPVVPEGELLAGYDVIFCGEFIEHVEQPWALLDALEACGQDERSLILLTCPTGPFGEIATFGVPRPLTHVHTFSARDLVTMAEHKRGYRWEYMPLGESVRGSAIGHWILGFQPGGGPGKALDYTTAILTERPYQRVNAALIVRNGAEWLRKCLDSLHGVVDAIRIVDFGSTDESVAIARARGAEVISEPWPDDFSVARNRSLAFAEPDAEWIFWIDADEHLHGRPYVRRYTQDGGPFTGYVVRQQHLMVDQPTFDDKPVRLFRTGRGIRFYGVIHEQPEQALNAGIVPALDQREFRIVHFGYEDEAVRRSKMKRRNLPLLMKEIHGEGTHPPRTLAWALYLRDCVNLATWEHERTPGSATSRVLAQRAIAVYRDRGFDDPAALLHDIAWPFYQQALRLLGTGIQTAWAFAAAPRRLDPKAAPKLQTFLVSTPEELERLTHHQIARWTAQLRPPVIAVAPYEPPPANAAVLPQTSALQEAA